ncbi:hypothetical protein BK816_05895 [Boudabousia tangfeifanii]|uniref:Uncharacterized protein n=1 Tax=Boudabousia tangfeifanii TaxID=1912795 RepID=A0A1D9MKK5_9ACTO|nr:hypothetical protein [Boudabousia tangfeifanii]AOZ72881.1 hypothetical protein BK816_05895 [Boudabousia tangfeifanii]
MYEKEPNKILVWLVTAIIGSILLGFIYFTVPLVLRMKNHWDQEIAKNSLGIATKTQFRSGSDYRNKNSSVETFFFVSPEVDYQQVMIEKDRAMKRLDSQDQMVWADAHTPYDYFVFPNNSSLLVPELSFNRIETKDNASSSGKSKYQSTSSIGGKLAGSRNYDKDFLHRVFSLAAKLPQQQWKLSQERLMVKFDHPWWHKEEMTRDQWISQTSEVLEKVSKHFQEEGKSSFISSINLTFPVFANRGAADNERLKFYAEMDELENPANKSSEPSFQAGARQLRNFIAVWPQALKELPDDSNVHVYLSTRKNEENNWRTSAWITVSTYEEHQYESDKRWLSKDEKERIAKQRKETAQRENEQMCAQIAEVLNAHDQKELGHIVCQSENRFGDDEKRITWVNDSDKLRKIS